MHTTPIRHTDPTRSLLRRATALAALGAASLALMAAVPASATDDKPPVDKNGKKSCYLKDYDDGHDRYTLWAPHGTTLAVHTPVADGPKTKTCDDGVWKYLRTSHDGGLVGGTRGALDGGNVSAKVLRVSPSVLRHLPVAPR
jgi:hypothetical protein